MVDFHKYNAYVSAARSADGPFVTRSSAFVVTYDDEPPLPKYPNVAWSIDGDAAALEGGGAPGDGTVYVDAGRGGASTLHAYVGPPVDKEIDVPIYAYRSLRLGCMRQPSATALTFAEDGNAANADAAAGADLAVRGVRCGTPGRQAIGLVARGGFAFVATPALRDFAAVPAAAWHEGGADAAGFSTYGTLLARLRDGRTLKFFMRPGGKTFVDAPYAIAAPGTEFADVAFVKSAYAPQSHRLPDRIRVPAATPRPRAADETIARTGPLPARPESRTP